MKTYLIRLVQAVSFVSPKRCVFYLLLLFNLPVFAQSSVTLSPLADAYVRSDAFAAKNYGADTALVVKATTTSGYSRRSYLKFSLASLSGVTSAKLRLYGSNTENTQSVGVAVFGVDGDNWTESGLTWNTAPAAATAALSTTAVSNTAQYYEWDVTAYVKAQLQGDKVVSLLVEDPATKNRNLAFYSKEYGQLTPQLVVENSTGNAAPAFSTATYSFSLPDTVALHTGAGTVSASDPDGDALTYAITAGNTNSTFAINATNGAITVAKYLNYHTDNKYILTVRAKDAGGLYDEATVTVNITRGVSTPDLPFITWGTAASQPYGTHEVHGVAVNKKLYIFGGYDVLKQPTWTPTKRSYVYNPVKNTWTAIADLPHTPNGTNFGGVTHEGLTTDGTDIYFAGGYTSNSDGSGQLFSTKQVWRYNVAANTYTALPDLPEPLAAGQMQYLKGKLHYMGGANKTRADVAVHYALDLDNLTAGWKALATLPDSCNHPGSAVYNGKIYFIGGAHHQDNATVTQKEVLVYDPTTNAWTKAASMPIGLDHISSSVIVLGNRILVLGGETSHNVTSNRVLAYSPASNTWTNPSQLPASKSAGVAAILNGTVHYTGGNFSKTNYKGTPTDSSTQKVQSFTLINADSNQPIQTLTSGSTLNLATLPTRNLNIKANTDPATIGSVVFNLSGAETVTVTESSTPYALFGDTKGDYAAWTPAVGSYSLKGTPYSGTKATGSAGISLTVNFTVVDQATTANATPVVTTGTNTSNEEKGLGMEVFPNPGKGDKVQVKVQQMKPMENATLSLTDLSGQVLKTMQLSADEQGKANVILIPGRQLLPGLYFIKLQTTSGKAEAKVIIN